MTHAANHAAHKVETQTAEVIEPVAVQEENKASWLKWVVLAIAALLVLWL